MTSGVSDGAWQDLLAVRAGLRALASRPEAEARLTAIVGRSAKPLLRDVYARLVSRIAGGPFVIGQLGQSLDGRIATVAGHSHYIGSAESLDHLHRLRALVDAVIVGAETAVADDPRLTVRRVPGTNPVRVLIDPHRRVGRDRQLFGPDARTLTVVGDDGLSGTDEVAVPRRSGRFDPADILAALAARGLHAVLVEGGPRTLSAFLQAGRLNRLHVAVAPLILGSGRPGVVLPPVARIGDGLRVTARTYALGVDVLFDCDLNDG